jgi:hypothetical protein
MFIIGCLASGCSKETTRQTSATEPVLSRQYRSGSALVVFSVSETNIPTSGKIQLMMDVHAKPETEVSFPEIEPSIKPFTVAETYLEPVQSLPNGKQLHRRVWQIVPKLPGSTTFQPLAIKVRGASVHTEPITVQVVSQLPNELETHEIKDIAASAALLPQQKTQQRFLFALLIFVGTLALVLSVFGIIRRPKKVIILPLHEVAFRSLDNLPEDALSRLQETRRILLAYMEGYFNISLAGKTTDQIIPVIPELPLSGHRAELAEFLTTNDLIRFSNRIPEGYIEKAEEFVRRFITETTEENPCD